MTLGILLLAGLVGRILASHVRLPSVTLYILAGLFVGPSVLGWVPLEHLTEMDPVVRLALAVVLFDIGSRFRFSVVRRILRPVLPLSAGELCSTFILVAVGLWAIGEAPHVAVLLGGLALATAPATTVVVLREYQSEGIVTNYTYALVALNNLAAIVAFELLFVLVALLEGGPGTGVGMRLLWLIVDLIGTTALGLIGGLIASLAANVWGERERALATLAIATVLLGACEWLELPYLLTFLAMGTTVANTSPHARQVMQELDPVASILYLVFFVVAGAELNLLALWTMGTIGLGYIALRSSGKYLGVRIMAHLRREPAGVRHWLGCTLIPQAGAAIGLVHIAAERDPQLGAHLEPLIVGTVVFFELAGPVLTKLAVVRAGEVPIAHLVHPHRPSWWEGILSVIGQTSRSVGGDPWAGRAHDALTVKDLMRRNVAALPNSADFLQVLEFVEHSRHHVYPVVAANGELEGTIRYRSIRWALFDREIASLVRAEDLSDRVGSVLLPHQSIDEALKLFETISDDVIPVVESHEKPMLVGLVERRDVVRFVKHRYAHAANSSST